MGRLELKVILNTGRSLKQGETKEAKTSRAYFEATAVCEMDPQDMEKLRLKEGDPVLVKTQYGEVIVAAKKSLDAPHVGIIFIPLGPWASMVVNPKTNHTGMPSFKGIPATISPLPGAKILDVKEIVEAMIK